METSQFEVFVVASGGVRNKRGKNLSYKTFEKFVAEWREATEIQSAAGKIQLPYLVGGVVKPAVRDGANVKARTLLTLDIEAGKGQETPPPPAAAARKLNKAGRAHWVYTTASHTEQAPRYRILLPLAEPITDEDVLKTTTRAAAELAGVGDWLDKASWTMAQAMYLPAHVAGQKPPWQRHAPGAATTPSAGTQKAASDPARPTAADIPLERLDPVLQAVRRAGLYKQKGKKAGEHYIECPWAHQHTTETDSKTIFYEAHHNGHAHAGVKCMSTSHDELTYSGLVQYLREEGHLQPEAAPDVLDDPEAFWASTAIGAFLDTQPKPLDFVVEGLCPLGKVAVLAGPGGVSKSSLALHILLAVSTGSKFGPFVARKARRCMYLSYEDDRQTIHGRLHAMYERLRGGVEGALYDLDLVRTNLHVSAVAGDALRWLLVTKEGKWGTPEATDRVSWLAKLLREQGVRLLVVDPVAYTHHLEESSPPEMAAYMGILGKLANEAGCAVLLLHHMHKAAQWASIDEINAGSVRGASSITDNARSVAVLVNLGQKDAHLYGLPATHDTVGRFAVFKHVKHNYSASLGMHLFERDGPLLLAKADFERLDAAEVQAAKEAQRAEAQERGDAVLAAKLLGMLRADPGATSNMVVALMGGARQRNQDLLARCQKRGWLAFDLGPNRSKCWKVTKEGRQWLSEQAL